MTYSDEVIDILNRIRIEILLEECHKLIEEVGQKKLTDNGLLVYALQMYKRQKKRVLKRGKDGG